MRLISAPHMTARLAGTGLESARARPRHPVVVPAFPRRGAAPQRSVVTRAAQKRPDDGAPAPEASLFEKDTTQVVIRCLTARAVQRVLLSLQEVDGWSAKWLNTWCATHPPLDGDKFIADLMLEAPVTLVDPYTGQSHAVSPTQIASGVLSVRQELAGHVAKGLPGAVAAGNVSVLRRHLEEHTYVSGDAGNDAARPSYRNYRRNRRAGGKAQRAAN